MLSIVNVCDVKSAEMRYACLKIEKQYSKNEYDMRFDHLIDALGDLWSGKGSSG